MTLGDFRTLFSGWLNRSDMTTDQATGFIRAGMERLQREVYNFPPMEKTVTVTATDTSGVGTVPLPSDFIAPQAVIADDQEVFPYSLDTFLREEDVVGEAYGYLRRGATIQLRPRASSYVELDYLGYLPDLTDDSSTSTILTHAPMVLLWACLSYAGDFFKIDETPTWEARFVSERDKLIAQFQDQDFNAAPQAMEAPPGVGAYL